jgi:hypothetical protein
VLPGALPSFATVGFSPGSVALRTLLLNVPDRTRIRAQEVAGKVAQRVHADEDPVWVPSEEEFDWGRNTRTIVALLMTAGVLLGFAVGFMVARVT